MRKGFRCFFIDSHEVGLIGHSFLLLVTHLVPCRRVLLRLRTDIGGSTLNLSRDGRQCLSHQLHPEGNTDAIWLGELLFQEYQTRIHCLLLNLMVSIKRGIRMSWMAIPGRPLMMETLTNASGP